MADIVIFAKKAIGFTVHGIQAPSHRSRGFGRGDAGRSDPVEYPDRWEDARGADVVLPCSVTFARGEDRAHAEGAAAFAAYLPPPSGGSVGKRS